MNTSSMKIGFGVPAALCLLATLVAACGFGEVVQPRPFALPRSRPIEIEPPRRPEVAGFLPWASDEPLLIIVDKLSRRLVLYRFGAPIRTYPVVIGRNAGRKLYEGDRRTPSGIYEIVGKHSHPKWDRFLAINYPNEADRENYLAALNAGRIPRSSPGTGGSIGIHGTDKEDLNRVGINWTYGCVSLSNRDVEELDSLVPEGTTVLIRDDIGP
jgi:murein L,D-transpeptidase YafK